MHAPLETQRDTESVDDAALLTLAETAEALRCSRTTLWRLIRSGHVVAFRVGSRVRIPVSELEDYLARRRVEPMRDPDVRRRWAGTHRSSADRREA